MGNVKSTESNAKTPRKGAHAQQHRSSSSDVGELAAPWQSPAHHAGSGPVLQPATPPTPLLQAQQQSQQQQQQQQQHSQPSSQLYLHVPQQGESGSLMAAKVAQQKRRFSFEVLNKVQHLQQQLALINPAPLLGLMEAAELLCRHLEVSFVSVVGFVPDEASQAGALGGALQVSPDEPAVLLAAHGRGALVAENAAVMRGAEWSHAALLARAAVATAREGPAFCHSDGEACRDGLPRDWHCLRQDAGLRGFASVLIGPQHAPLGALTVASTERHRLDDKEWWQLWLNAAATGLLHIMHHWQVAFTCRMLRRVDAIDDPMLFISSVLQSGRVYMLRASNLPMEVRLAVLDDADRSRALVFASEHRAKAPSGPPQAAHHHGAPACSASAALPSAAAAAGADGGGVVATSLDLANTLLKSAMAMGKARFVRNSAAYMQTCVTPARDMFLSSSEPVASLVVVPMVVKDMAFGAIYFTMDTPSDFANLQDALLGFVVSVTLVIHQKLAGRTRLLWNAMSEAKRAQSARLPRVLSSSGGSLRLGSHGRAPDAAAKFLQLLEDDENAGDGPGGAPPMSPVDSPDGSARAPGVGGGGGGGAAGDSCPLSALSSRRLCTEAMMEVVKSEIMRNQSRSFAPGLSGSPYIPELTVGRVIGTGGYGVVYKGTWKKITAAIKVFYARSSEREAMKDAVEMAVLNTVHHPNIVSVYACLTDVVEVADADSIGTSSSGGGSNGRLHIRPRYRRLLPDEEHEGAVCSIVAMEFCDGGTLRHAIKRGAFHRRMASGEIGVDLPAVLSVLQEVCEAVQYFHTLNLVHCDIKTDNVLLKSDPSRQLGFVPKLADFGLVKILKDNYIRNRSGAGTVTHLAPEMLTAGSRITTAVDSFAFGVLMYEIYTGRRPYHGLTREAIISHVRNQQLRPTFPPGTPLAFARLAERCWGQDPEQRPGLDLVAAELAHMSAELMSSLGPTEGAGGSPGGSPGGHGV